MHPNRLQSRRAASFRSGFTLVELLVVIGIIAILAGVALGPITNGIKKAKQSSGLQSAHALGLAMYSCANDNNQLYPDVSGGNADNVAATLLAGGYVTDATIFHISSDTGSGSNPVTSSNNTATTIGSSGVTSWDFLGNAGSGVSSTQFTFLPILWTTLAPATHRRPSTSPPEPRSLETPSAPIPLGLTASQPSTSTTPLRSWSPPLPVPRITRIWSRAPTTSAAHRPPTSRSTANKPAQVS